MKYVLVAGLDPSRERSKFGGISKPYLYRITFLNAHHNENDNNSVTVCGAAIMASPFH